MIYLSLCIPTNGISEWVFPVLDCIYHQNADHALFEVIVTDNGNNENFQSGMKEYIVDKDNLIYKKTDAFLFENQIEALRLASGMYLKFLNHRSLLENGALEWMIEKVKENQLEKPIMFLSNGELGFKKAKEYVTFDGFVAGLKHYASWTTGVGVWKTDFDRIPKDWVYNKISPHSDVLFFERERNKYIIDDKKWSHDVDSSHAKKGKYDLYKAFAIEEISITLGLYLNGNISSKTLKQVIKSYKKFVVECYRDFNIMHVPCSYNLDGFNDAMGVFMNRKDVIIRAYMSIPMDILRKIWRKIRHIS